MGRGENWEGFEEVVIGMEEFMKENGGGCAWWYIPIGCKRVGRTLREEIWISISEAVFPMLDIFLVTCLSNNWIWQVGTLWYVGPSTVTIKKFI